MGRIFKSFSLPFIVLLLLAAACTDRVREERTPADQNDSDEPDLILDLDPEPDLTLPHRDIPSLSLFPPPETVTFTFGPEVQEGLRRDVEGAVGLASRYYRQVLGIELPTLTVEGYADVDTLVDRFMTKNGGGSAGRQFYENWWQTYIGAFAVDTIFLRLDWIPGEYDPTFDRGDLTEAVTHEVAHAVHAARTNGSRDRRAELAGVPRWFIEGAAEFDTHLILHAFGFEPYDHARREAARQSRTVPDPLDNLADTNDAIYRLGFLAADFLGGTEGSRAFVPFWDAIGQGSSWPVAFLNTFKQTPQEFLRSFDQYRQANFPRHRGILSGRVTEDGEKGVIGYRVIVCAGSGCYSSSTDAAGFFEVAVPNGRYTIRAAQVVSGHTSLHAGHFYAGGGASTTERAKATRVAVSDDPVRGLDFALNRHAP